MQISKIEKMKNPVMKYTNKIKLAMLKKLYSQG